LCGALQQTQVGCFTAAAAMMTMTMTMMMMMKSYKRRKLHLYKKKLLPLCCVFFGLPADSLGHGSVPLPLVCKSGVYPPA
jgi:hypothetical protein